MSGEKLWAGPRQAGGVPSVVLAGLESAGKSALYRGLTGEACGDEANFRGSTVMCRRCHVADCACEVVDTPGISLSGDADTTRRALEATGQADVILLVVRGTHLKQEMEALAAGLNLNGRRSAVVVTFKDKAPAEVEEWAEQYRMALGVPVVVVNARVLDAAGRGKVVAAIQQAVPLASPARPVPPALRVVQPEKTWFEHPLAGPWVALAAMGFMFALPVLMAYQFASWLQPVADAAVITPLREHLAFLPPLPEALLTGSYGVITLGWYSFLWAFPVVALISLSVAVVEETGLKDRLAAALDPWLRGVGLTGRDVIPVLTGFGCNVVAVFQSRACTACTRKSCVSLISFGSACSYQIGASLSVFGASGHPSLFLPYMILLFVAGLVHTRLWHGHLSQGAVQPLHERAFLQWPAPRAVGWRLRAALKQFLTQAMPVFLGICLAAAFLEHLGAVAWAADLLAPAAQGFHLPPQAVPAVLFSILRKDGLLILNSGEGDMVGRLGAGQVFLVVWLASTLTACLVTLWTVRRELGWRTALTMAGRQAVTSLVTAFVISRLWGES